MKKAAFVWDTAETTTRFDVEVDGQKIGELVQMSGVYDGWRYNEWTKPHSMIVKSTEEFYSLGDAIGEVIYELNNNSKEESQ